MIVNASNTNFQINQSKYNSSISFRSTNYQTDTFEVQKKTDNKYKIATFVSTLTALSLTAALVFKHKKLVDVKANNESLEKAKEVLEKEKSSVKKALDKAKEDSDKKVKKLEDKIKKLEDDAKNIKKQEEITIPKAEKIESKTEVLKEQKNQNIIETRIENDAEKLSQIQTLAALNNRKGISRIIGYTELKSEIISKIIEPIKNNESNLPNLVLFYGPKGCGKTTFLKATKEACKCNEQKLFLSLNSNKDLNQLTEAIKKAGENYQNNGKHTILYIDEINGFMQNTDSNTKKIMNNLSTENHCTLLATTNYPEKINKNIIPDIGFEQYYVGPATETEIEEILKYYIPVITKETINYPKLTRFIKNKGCFSNAKIVSEITRIIKENSKPDTNITQTDLEKLLKDLTPDIKEDVINSYEKYRKGI